MKKQTQDILVFTLLVAIAVLGRWLQPAWGFTPLAAVTIFAGCYFTRWAAALIVPIVAMMVSNLTLPAYDYLPVMLTVYASLALPVVLGRWIRKPAGTALAKGMRVAACGLLPATLFYLLTNLAIWLFTPFYASTWNGLVDCYVAAIPFYRGMLLGDLCYGTALALCVATAFAAESWSLQGRMARIGLSERLS